MYIHFRLLTHPLLQWTEKDGLNVCRQYGEIRISFVVMCKSEMLKKNKVGPNISNRNKRELKETNCYEFDVLKW